MGVKYFAGQKLFAVTDQLNLMFLEIETITIIEDKDGNFFEIITKVIKDKESRHIEASHKAYFRKVYSYIEFEHGIDNGRIFDTFEIAKGYALQQASNKISTAKEQVRQAEIKFKEVNDLKP